MYCCWYAAPLKRVAPCQYGSLREKRRWRTWVFMYMRRYWEQVSPTSRPLRRVRRWNRHVADISALVNNSELKQRLLCFQAGPRHQPGGVRWWRSLWNHRRLRDRTKLRLRSLWEGETLIPWFLYSIFDLPYTHACVLIVWVWLEVWASLVKAHERIMAV